DQLPQNLFIQINFLHAGFQIIEIFERPLTPLIYYGFSRPECNPANHSEPQPDTAPRRVHPGRTVDVRWQDIYPQLPEFIGSLFFLRSVAAVGRKTNVM